MQHVALRASGAEVNIRDCMLEAFLKEGLPASDARQEADRLLRPVGKFIDDHISTYMQRGLVTYYQRKSGSPNHAIPTAGSGNFRWTAEAQDILIKMRPRDFEILLANLLVQTDFAEVAVTPLGGDGGFDFIGRRDTLSASPSGSRFRSRFLLSGQNWYSFGQAKRYSLHHPVSVEQVHSLVGAATTSINTGGSPTIDRIKAGLEVWGWRPRSPLTPAFATSGRYVETVRGLARTGNWAVLDGEQIAQKILDSGGSVLASSTDVRTLIGNLTQPLRTGVSWLPRV